MERLVLFHILCSFPNRFVIASYKNSCNYILNDLHACTTAVMVARRDSFRIRPRWSNPTYLAENQNAETSQPMEVETPTSQAMKNEVLERVKPWKSD